MSLSFFKKKNCVFAGARIVLGSVAFPPFRAYDAEKMLIGEKLNSVCIDAAAISSSKMDKPIDNIEMNLSFCKKW